MPLVRPKAVDAQGTKIFYATDVHGSERTWRKFLNAGAFYGADVLVMGGDVMGKLAIPIIREARRALPRHDPRPGRATARRRAEVEAARAPDRRSSGSTTSSWTRTSTAATQADPAAVDRALRASSRPSGSRAGSTSPRRRLAGTGIQLLRDRRQRRPARGDGRRWTAPDTQSVRRLRGPRRAARRRPRHGQHAVREPDALEHAARGGRSRSWRERIERDRGRICRPPARHLQLPRAARRTRRLTPVRARLRPPIRRRRSSWRPARAVRRRQHGRPRRHRALSAAARACTATSTSRRRRRGSGGRCASTPAASTARASCAAACITLADGKVEGLPDDRRLTRAGPTASGRSSRGRCDRGRSAKRWSTACAPIGAPIRSPQCSR